MVLGCGVEGGGRAARTPAPELPRPGAWLVGGASSRRSGRPCATECGCNIGGAAALASPLLDGAEAGAVLGVTAELSVALSSALMDSKAFIRSGSPSCVAPLPPAAAAGAASLGHAAAAAIPPLGAAAATSGAVGTPLTSLTLAHSTDTTGAVRWFAVSVATGAANLTLAGLSAGTTLSLAGTGAGGGRACTCDQYSPPWPTRMIKTP